MDLKWVVITWITRPAHWKSYHQELDKIQSPRRVSDWSLFHEVFSMESFPCNMSLHVLKVCYSIQNTQGLLVNTQEVVRYRKFNYQIQDIVLILVVERNERRREYEREERTVVREGTLRVRELGNFFFVYSQLVY